MAEQPPPIPDYWLFWSDYSNPLDLIRIACFRMRPIKVDGSRRQFGMVNIAPSFSLTKPNLDEDASRREQEKLQSYAREQGYPTGTFELRATRLVVCERSRGHSLDHVESWPVTVSVFVVLHDRPDDLDRLTYSQMYQVAIGELFPARQSVAIDDREPVSSLVVLDWWADLGEYWRDAAIPSERDDAIGRVVALLAAEPWRRAGLNHGRARMLDVYAERMASLAVRTGSPDDLRRGLTALALAGTATGDWRDEVVVMAPLWNSAERIGLDPSVEFRTIGAQIGGKGGDLLISFAHRTPANQTLKIMGYTEGTDDDGFRYQRTR